VGRQLGRYSRLLRASSAHILWCVNKIRGFSIRAARLSLAASLIAAFTLAGTALPTQAADTTNPVSLPTSFFLSKDGLTVTLFYSEQLHPRTAPPEAFRLRINGGEGTFDTATGTIVAISSVATSDSAVLLRLANPILAGVPVRVWYKSPPRDNSTVNFSVQDLAGNDAAGFTLSPGRIVTNRSTVQALAQDLVPPRAISAAVDGTSVTLTFSERLATRTAPLSAYTVFVGNDIAVLSNTTPVVSGNNITLQLQDPAPPGALALVSYLAPAPDADLSEPDSSNFAIQDLAGNDAASFDVRTSYSASPDWAWTTPYVSAENEPPADACRRALNASGSPNVTDPSGSINRTRQTQLPNGVFYTVGVTGAGVCINDTTESLFDRGGIAANFTSIGLVDEPGVRLTTRDQLTCVQDTPCYQGDLTISFSESVSNPVVSMAGLGAGTAVPTWTELELVTPGLTMQRLSGTNIQITQDGTYIEPINKLPDIGCETFGDRNNSPAAATAACGSIQIIGTARELKFRVYLGKAGTTTGTIFDAWNLTASIVEDFGLAPASYDKPVAAHVVGALRLGTNVDGDNLSRLYSDFNDEAISAGSAITSSTVGADKYDDGVSAWASNPSLSMVPGETYTVPVSVQGVESGKTANLCGWIDFNRDGLFSVGERACAPAITAVGSSTQNLVWLIPSDVVGGQTYARIRLSYDPVPVATGRAGSGEVEDYSFTILPKIVTFDSNGGTGTMADQISSTTADLTPKSFTRDGYEFLGWNTAADGSGTPYVDGDTYAFTADMTLYAQWKQIPTVTFIANEGTGTMADQTSPVTADLTPKSFTRDGYVFAGWNTKADGTGELYADGASYPFTENLTLYAQWAAVEIPTTATAVATYTVTFMSNDGTGTMNPQTSAVSADISRNTFIREGYVFAGWNTAADGSGELYADEASHAFTENLTLYAQWAAVAVPPTPYTVTFLANDPSNSTTGSMSPQTAAEVTSLTPENFTREGYEFIGWNTAASGKGIAYDDEASYAFRADLTLYAQWVALPVYTVTYVANDGTGVMQPQTSSTPESLTSNIFSRDGYTFVGWNTEADGSGTPVANASTYDFSADMTLYAQWTPVPDAPPQSGPAPAPALSFTVTYFANGGDGVMQAQVSAVPLAFDRNLFTRAGFTFQGWNTDPDGSGVSYGANHIFHFESDLALYAQWLEDPVIALPEDPAPGPQALANTGDSFATGALLPLSALALALGFLLFRLGAHRNLHRNRPSIH